LDEWKTQETFRRYFEYVRAAAWDKPRSARAPPGLGILMESFAAKIPLLTELKPPHRLWYNFQTVLAEWSWEIKGGT
jgi:hypothetical protein